MAERMIFTNNAVGELATPVSPADTSLTLKAGQGAFLPDPGPTEYALLSLMFEEQFEVVRLTERTGDVLTVTRAQDSTLAQAFPVDSVVELRIVRATMDAFVQRTEDLALLAGALKADGTVPATDRIVYNLTAAAHQNVVDARIQSSPKRWGLGFYWDGGTEHAFIAQSKNTDETGHVEHFRFGLSGGAPYTSLNGPLYLNNTVSVRHAVETPEYLPAYSLRVPEWGDGYIYGFHIRGTTAGFHFSVTSQPAYFQMRMNNGDFLASGNVIAYASDVRLKQDFKVIDQPLEKLAQIGGYEFNWRGDTPQPFRGHAYGVLAQDVQRVFPESVELAAFDRAPDDTSASGKDYLAVKNDHTLVALLIECVKALTSRVQELERRTHP